MGENFAMGYINPDEKRNEDELHKIFGTKENDDAWSNIDPLWMLILFALFPKHACNEESELKIIEYKHKTAPRDQSVVEKEKS